MLGFTSRRRKAPGRCLSNAVPEREATAKVARLRMRFPFWALRRTDTLAPSPCTGHRGWVITRSGRCPIALLRETFQGRNASELLCGGNTPLRALRPISLLPGLIVVCFGRFWVRGLRSQMRGTLGHPFQRKKTLPWHLGPAAKVRILRFKNLPPFRHYRGLQNHV